MRLLAALVVALLAHGDVAPQPPPLQSVTLWSWERPDDLRWLAGSGVRVAMLDRTLLLSGGRLEARLRRQPLLVADDTPLMAVVRIETDGTTLPDSLVPDVADHIAAASRVPRVTAVQIDFDARRSERDFYRVVLQEVRRRLSAPLTLSMTALASWCTDDPWIDDGLVHEVVPMLFEMGPDGQRIVRRLQAEGRWPVPACNGALGLSTSEPWPDLLPVRTLYLWRARTADIATTTDLRRRLRTGARS